VNDRRSAAGDPARSKSLIAVLGVLLASALVGFVAYRLLRPAEVTLRPGASMAAPRSSSTGADALADPAIPARTVPDQLPDIRLPGTDGAMHKLSDWKGKPLLVNFWATWCEPCRREIPLLKSLRREHAAERLEIVGIAVDQAQDVRKYVKTHTIDYPVLVGEDGGLAAATALGMDTVLPFSVFADAQGHVVTLKVGELHQDEAELILGRLQDVGTGRLTLPAARAQIAAGIRRLSQAHSGSG
jgi:thiol-disulfide isomerase/thioredoxin